MTDQPSSALAELMRAISPRNRRVMKRCFMTGKQCIFSSQVAEGASHPLSAPDLTTFVITSFRPNLETFYRWSLKPFLVKGYGLPEKHVQRADEVREIGYIVCEKICRKIQEADLVLAEMSVKNSNVFYELGMAYGLNRPVILMRDEQIQARERVLEDKCVEQSLNLQSDQAREKILEYPGIGALDLYSDKHKLSPRVIHPPKYTRPIRKLQISILRIEPESAKAEALAVRGSTHNDISLNFIDVLKGAVGVVMADIRNDLSDPSDEHTHEPWAEVVRSINNETWKDFSTANMITVDGRRSFDDVAQNIESSFCTIVDVSANHPVACFWLGYCHARGLNAIPVYRLSSTGQPDDDFKLMLGVRGQTAEIPLRRLGAADSQSDGELKLAFDIRALWYAEYDDQKPYEFKTKIREILEHLLERDLPDRQKRAFWDRFPPERKIKVFTGAIHNPSLNREMVGDWDVRAVSELFSYLPSVREARAIELVTPLYSPEEAFKRSGSLVDDEDARAKFIDSYRRGIEAQLEGANAIVIASPDVNPVTEYLLHKIYGVQAPIEPFDECPEPSFDGWVVLKELEKIPPPDPIKFPRLFYCEKEAQEESSRGFAPHHLTSLFDRKSKLGKYLAQDKCQSWWFSSTV
jgi:hypothetical protein